jgi:hypothetical protein
MSFALPPGGSLVLIHLSMSQLFLLGFRVSLSEAGAERGQTWGFFLFVTGASN